MGASQRAKGKRGERDAADLVRRFWGISARRGRQYAGHPDAPDVWCDAPIYIEAKWRAVGNPGAWLAEAAAQAPTGQVPIVLHKRPRCPVLVTLYAEHVPALAEAIVAARKDTAQ